MAKSNEIKKGMRIQLKNGWYGTMMDNMRGNIRMAEVEGYFTEIGSVYAHDIARFQPVKDGEWVEVGVTSEQAKLEKLVEDMFGGA